MRARCFLTDSYPACLSLPCFFVLLFVTPPSEQNFMTTMTPTAPDEESPLLGTQRGPAIGRTVRHEPEVITSAGPSNRGSRTPSVRNGMNINERSGVVKKTPLPWAQLSITLHLLLMEPLTSQVISPVSPSAGFLLIFCFGAVSHRPKGFNSVLKNPLSPSFRSLHPRSVRTTCAFAKSTR